VIQTKSLGARLTLVCAACLAVVIVSAGVMNALAVRALQDHIRRDSLQLAEENAKQVASAMGRLGAGGSANGPAADEYINFFVKQNGIVAFSCVVDVRSDGSLEVIRGRFRDEGIKQELMPEDSEFRTEIEMGDKEALEILLERRSGNLDLAMAPLEAGADSGWRLAYALDESEIFKRIESAGEKITLRVQWMTALLSAALIGAFIVVWALVRGQWRLQGENERLNLMAYVGTLASGLAHEIRNPLNAMSVNLEVIEEDLDDPREDSPQRIGSIVKHLRTETRQLDSALNNFLEFALPHKGKIERVSLGGAVRQALAALQSKMDSERIGVDIDVDPGLQILGDPAGIRQVFHNIAMNAIQAMNGEKGRLAIRGWTAKGRVCLAFEDTGPGIPAQSLEKIFEVYSSSKPGGSGFGLAIARRIVQDHGGTIRAESPEGKGAVLTMEFLLPKGPQGA
jgi:signal transduction histidine kinase